MCPGSDHVPSQTLEETNSSNSCLSPLVRRPYIPDILLCTHSSMYSFFFSVGCQDALPCSGQASSRQCLTQWHSCAGLSARLLQCGNSPIIRHPRCAQPSSAECPMSLHPLCWKSKCVGGGALKLLGLTERKINFSHLPLDRPRQTVLQAVWV